MIVEVNVDVYCAMNNNTVVRRKAKVVEGIVLQIDCLECGGTGWWDFGPDEEEPGPCVQCKGTGKQYLGI